MNKRVLSTYGILALAMIGALTVLTLLRVYNAATAAQVPWPSISLTLVTDALTSPVLATHSGDGSGRIFIVQQSGQILIYQSGALLPTPFLDISSMIINGGERGLLGLSFPPDYANRGYFFVNYTRAGDGATVISRFYRSLADADIADPTSEEIILVVPQPYSNHNGGHLAFDPVEGYLYIGLGDGGSAGDPLGNAQNPTSLLGKMLRIDVLSTSLPITPSPTPSPYQLHFPLASVHRLSPYIVPETNPYVGVEGYREEIWALGLRNPWRFSFDAETYDLYIADVGQGTREEINFQLHSSSGGENYGWNVMEGSICYNSPTCDISGLVLPVMDYDHSLGCSVTGGYVYRGSTITDLQGIYLFGDYCSGRIWGLRFTGTEWEHIQFLDASFRISSFGEDELGNLYVFGYDTGEMYLIVSSP
jgi:glucose/arabinose dehydrogenase